MKILITGGAGFIGSHLVKRFELENEVHILDNLGPTSCKKRLSHYKNLFVYDISDYKTYQHIAKDYDLVINSAAETHVDESFIRPMDFIKTNVEGLHLLAKYCADNQIPLIHLSTDEVIGTGKPLFENSMHLPTNPYSATKSSGESILHAYGYCYNLNWKVVRLNNTYGTMQFPDKLIPYFIKSIDLGKKLPIHGSGKQVRFFLHVEDFVNAVDIVNRVGDNKNIYNVSTDESYDVLHVTQMLCEVMGVEIEKFIKYVPDRLFQDPIYLSNSDKLRAMGWEPKFSLKETLPNIVTWYRDNQDFFNE